MDSTHTQRARDMDPSKMDAQQSPVDPMKTVRLLVGHYAAEQLTWLEAAVFFLFAIRQFPDEAPTWAPLAAQRWERCAASPRPRPRPSDPPPPGARARAILPSE